MNHEQTNAVKAMQKLMHSRVRVNKQLKRSEDIYEEYGQYYTRWGTPPVEYCIKRVEMVENQIAKQALVLDKLFGKDKWFHLI